MMKPKRDQATLEASSVSSQIPNMRMRSFEIAIKRHDTSWYWSSFLLTSWTRLANAFCENAFVKSRSFAIFAKRTPFRQRMFNNLPRRMYIDFVPVWKRVRKPKLLTFPHFLRCLLLLSRIDFSLLEALPASEDLTQASEMRRCWDCQTNIKLSLAYHLAYPTIHDMPADCGFPSGAATDLQVDSRRTLQHDAWSPVWPAC